MSRRLDHAALAALLAHLGGDPDSAGRAYEDLRQRLLAFYRSRLVPEAEELADECLDRVSRRLKEGEEVRSIRLYVRGIAQRVLQEHLRLAQLRGAAEA